MMQSNGEIPALLHVLQGMERIAVAVSGGVDSLTLAAFAHRRLADRVEMFHAVSPAVPEQATARVNALADQESWRLHIVDAGEFADPNYRLNPLNRCFYCKTHLYASIVPLTQAQIVSGANRDDLGEYRPGLEAAKQHGVRHPYVEAGMDKRAVRALAHALGLPAIAELPASPCLSSRIETGIGIDPQLLALVHRTEQLAGERLQPKTVRCRVRAQGVVIELDEARLAALTFEERKALTDDVCALFEAGGFHYGVSFAPYRIGSAFLHRLTPLKVN
jgi:uncharacterized protein